jgi:hypothetical protein
MVISAAAGRARLCAVRLAGRRWPCSGGLRRGFYDNAIGGTLPASLSALTATSRLCAPRRPPPCAFSGAVQDCVHALLMRTHMHANMHARTHACANAGTQGTGACANARVCGVRVCTRVVHMVPHTLTHTHQHAHARARTQVHARARACSTASQRCARLPGNLGGAGYL